MATKLDHEIIHSANHVAVEKCLHHAYIGQ